MWLIKNEEIMTVAHNSMLQLQFVTRHEKWYTKTRRYEHIFRA